jgi:perosamine synthetase
MASIVSERRPQTDGLASAVVERLRAVLGAVNAPVALHEPHFSGKEWDYLKDCLDTGWVSTAGAYVSRFEQSIADTCGVPHVIAVVNGTAALHIALTVMAVEQDDEVLVPALTFVATAAAIRYCGAIPHFVDSEATTLGLDPAALARRLDEIGERTSSGLRNRETGRRIAAIVPVHIFGHPVDMDAIAEVARRYDLPVVEDAAEGLGSKYKGRHVGGDGVVSTLSFNGNKIITTGGGGAVITRDAALAKRVRHLTTTARIPHRWNYIHDEVGYNYRLPNLNAALGLAQMEQLPRFVAAKRALHQRYCAGFAGFSGATLMTEQPWAASNFWLNAILLDRDDEALRDDVLDAANKAEFATRPIWSLLHRLPAYQDCPRGELAAAEALERRIICLPSSPKLGLSL